MAAAAPSELSWPCEIRTRRPDSSIALTQVRLYRSANEVGPDRSKVNWVVSRESFQEFTVSYAGQIGEIRISHLPLPVVQ